MSHDDYTADNAEQLNGRYEVDFQTMKCLSHFDLYDEYVLESYGNIAEIFSDESEKGQQQIGHIKVRLVQMGRIMNDDENIFELYDSFDQYFHDIYGELFDAESDGFSETLCRQFKTLSDGCNILLIDEVEILPAYRRKRIGLASVHRAIDIFGARDCLVIISTYPPQFYDRRDDLQWKAKMRSDVFVKDEQAACTKLERYWHILGFERIWDSRYICALCTNNKYPSIQEIYPD